MPAEEAQFRVVYSGKVKENLQAILRKAKKLGELDPMVQAVLEADHRMETDPWVSAN